MSTSSSQSFRALSSTKVISIPTRHDPKSGQHVVLWRDIQRCFTSAQYVLCTGDVVLFLSDGDFEDLIPLRIAHHPGVVLEVVGSDDNQVGPRSVGPSSNNSFELGELSGVTGSSIEAVSVVRDVSSMTISRTDRNQTLVVRPQDRSLEMTVQQLPTSATNHFLLEAGDSKTQQEALHLFQRQVDQLNQKMEEVLGRIQQTDQQMEEVLRRTLQGGEQRQHTQHDMQEQIDRILQTVEQMDLHRQQDKTQHASLQQLQHQIEVVQQKMQQLDQETQDSRQQLHDIQQQMQQQMDKVFIDVQKLDQKADQSRQQHEQLLKQIHDGMGVHLSSGITRRETQQAFGQFVHARCLVQDVLAEPSSKVPIPRLFIILPAPTTIEGQGESCSFRFRLYFLCECGSHTMTQGCNKPHEVHLSNHHGYDLINQDDFINNYRPYLLTMMYMVRYGAKTRELMVQPLLGLNHAIGENENIGQLVDSTITYLKGAGLTDGDSTTHLALDALEFTKLKSHLKVMDGESFSGNLSQMKTQKAHYLWICSDHLRECYESTLQQLRFNINTSNGLWHGNEIKVKVTSNAMIQLLYDDLSKLFRIQSVEKWRYITGIDLKLGSHQSASSPTTETSRDFDDLESLSVDFDRLTMSVKDIFRGEVKDVAISIGDLSTLTLDDLEFIYQCPPGTLEISKTRKEDESRLVSLLQSNVTTLWIGCDLKRYIATIDLVISARERMLQSGYRPALRTFELAHPGVNVKVCFDEGSPALDMAPCIDLGNCQSYIVEPAMYNFIRQNGWSAITFVMPESFSDRLAILLEESMQETVSRIARLDITPTSLTTPGLNAISRVINQSQGLTYLRLSLENLGREDQLKKALLLVERHKDRLTSLRLEGCCTRNQMVRIAQSFPDKDGFPVLEEFVLEGVWMECLSDIECQWIASMVSNRPRPFTPLKVFRVTDNQLSVHAWRAVILAIDFSTIEELHLQGLYIPREMKLLAGRIMDSDVSSLPLRILDFKGTHPSGGTARGMFARIRERAPQVEVRWE